MEKIINSFEGWQILYKKAIKESVSENQIQVLVGRQDNPEGDIQNLCYFFPLVSWLRDNGKISESNPILLDIRLHRDGLGKDAKMDSGDFERIDQFLDFLNNDSCFRIMCNGKTVEKRKRVKLRVSRIFPLCEVGGEEKVDYHILKKSFLKRAEGLTESQSNLFSLAERNVNYIKKYDKYSGTSDRNFFECEKNALRSTVNSYLEQHLDEMDVLSIIVWMYILKELIGEKILYTIPENNADVPVIRENVLSKSRMDAIAYGEAMYQLIENACIHSLGKKAWFGIRIHRAGKNEPMSRLVEETRTRNQLHEKYKSCIFDNKNDKEHENRWNIFNEDFRFYFEFYVLDSAMDQQEGMVPNYNSKSGKNIGRIKDLFDIMPDEISRDKYVEDTTEHYGLCLLRDIVYANRGYLYGKSPNHSNCSQYYYDGLADEKSEDIYVTEWSALLPISDYWYGEDDKPLRTGSANNIFGDQIEDAGKIVSYCSGEQIFQGLLEEKKKDDIEKVRSNLKSIFDKADRNILKETILVLQIKDNDGYKMEILSKALLAKIVEVNFGKDADSVIPLHIVLILPTVNAAHEFVRLFSVFYRKGTLSGMANIQIALCSHRREDPETLKVDFILAGKTLSDVMENAKAFAYHHTEDSLEYIPLLAYLTQRKRGQSEDLQESIEPVFPFDLFLTDHMEELNGKRLDINTIWKKSLFTNHVDRIINTNLRSGKMGCKLKDIHIRLGSKIHIDTFYEAELLFHDTGNVLRFAYLIAQSLLCGDNLLKNNRPVLLLGYEQYSSSLILQIEYWLRQSDRFPNVYSAVVYNEPVSGRVIVDRNFDNNKKDKKNDDTIQPVIIVPIGTTLSTIYKIREEARKHLGNFKRLNDAEFNWNYCLIVANRELFKKDAMTEVTARYWKPDGIDGEKQLITVQPESIGMPEMRSRYLIAANSEWHAPEQCEICEKCGDNTRPRPIIDMKFTDTIPGAIFPLLGEREGTFDKLIKDPIKNRRHMRILRGHLHYAHIYSGFNHFQFIFDFRDLFSQNEEMILNEIKTWKAEPAAFHVLVSPLQMRNSAFIKALIDYVFRGKVRFLRLELKETYREEVRAKFSYIIEDFKRLKISDHKAKICIHYADTSIVMGNTINRARLLVKMLLNQSGISHEDVELFSKIYLLVNRCSYDTIHYFVRDPSEDLKAFIQLALPSYNTENNLCPACRLAEKYELLAKRSSTQRISTEFTRLGEKHGKRTREEYDNWIRKAIKEKHPYLAWLMRWLYVNVPTQGEELLDFLPPDPKEAGKDSGKTAWEKGNSERKEVFDKAKEVKKKIDEYYSNYMKEVDGDNISREKTKQYKWLNRLNDVCLKDIAENDNAYLDKVADLVYDRLIATHDYMMLEAMQKSYEEIEKSDEMEEDVQYASVRKIMLDLIADVIIERKEEYPPLMKIPEQEAKRFLLVRNMEWMISYFKVLSREQISNYYDCRQAIMGIISDVWDMLSGEQFEFEQHEEKLVAEDKSWKKIINVLKECCYGELSSKEPQLTASLQYQFQAMLVHRMAHFQSTDMTGIDMVDNMVRSYNRLLTRYFSVFEKEDKSEVRYLGLPSKDGFILRYLKSVKTATMTTRDDIPCLKIEETLMSNKSKFSDEDLGENNALSLIMKYLYLENVKILYYGMRELEDLIPLHEEKEIDCSVDAFVSNMQELDKNVQKHLADCYRDKEAKTDDEAILFQNSLSVFCRFWCKSTGEIPISTDQNKISILTYMFHYYRLLSYLSEDRKKSFQPDNMPYLYEELCRCMCGITDSKMCYIAYQSDGDMPEIFTQSGYYLDYIANPRHKILTPQDMELVLRRSCAVWKDDDKKKDDQYQDDYMLIPGIAVLSEEEKDKFLVVRIALKDTKLRKSFFYIVLQMEEIDDEDDSIGILRKARNILFMREKLQAVLSKDYIVLINFRFDCSYIKPYRKEKKAEPIILHISDLHADVKMDSSVEEIIKIVRKHIQDSLGDKKVDLLAVTGDLIDGRDASAPKVEQNYQNAAKLLDGIVQELWTDKAGYISHDWKRRVMIVTGNHDYASMNQFRAVLKNRTLAAGMPVDGESGTMSKFAYYIDFLIRYLDAPTDRLLNNDLNEIRFYRNLGIKGIKVLMLNSSSLAAPRRTNKMGANAEKVKALINSNLWNPVSVKSTEATEGPFRLCLMHHAPNYKPNYFLDNYTMLPGWEKKPGKEKIEPINELTYCFIESVKEMFEVKFGLRENTGKVKSEGTDQQGEQCSKTEQFLKEVKCLKKALEKLQGKRIQKTTKRDIYYERLVVSAGEEMLRHSLEDIGKAIEVIVRKYEQNDLYQQMLSYASWCEMTNGDDNGGYQQSNEQISRLLLDVYECFKMSETDEENYKQLMEGIKQKGTIDLYLSGHIHAYQEDGENNTLIADVLYRSKGNEVNGYIVTIKSEKGEKQKYGFGRL